LQIEYLERYGLSKVDVEAGRTAKVDFAPLGDNSTMQVETSDGSEDV